MKSRSIIADQNLVAHSARKPAVSCSYFCGIFSSGIFSSAGFIQLFKLLKKGERYPEARAEALTALRCLKAVHSNAIKDKKVDRIFLQVLLHGAGVSEKSLISRHYKNASNELRGQEELLRSLEKEAEQSTPFSLSMLLEMHRKMFDKSWPETAGRFRQGEVRFSAMAHRPPH